jgi:hypothetical protein
MVIYTLLIRLGSPIDRSRSSSSSSNLLEPPLLLMVPSRFSGPVACRSLGREASRHGRPASLLLFLPCALLSAGWRLESPLLRRGRATTHRGSPSLQTPCNHLGSTSIPECRHERSGGAHGTASVAIGSSPCSRYLSPLSFLPANFQKIRGSQMISKQKLRGPFAFNLERQFLNLKANTTVCASLSTDFGALFPSKSGPIHRHSVKHSVKPRLL